jgi:hypothetical protein
MAEKKTDWDAVEPQYRAGIKSLRQLAEEFGCTSGRVAQVAKARGWERDLSHKIQAKVESALSRAAVSADISTKRKATETEVIDASAAAITNVVMAHRTDISALRGKARDYQRELDECGEDLSKRVSILKMLTDTQKTLIAAEREAFGLATGADITATINVQTDEQRRDRIASLRKKLNGADES